MATAKSTKKAKVCPIVEAGITHIDYKDIDLLKKHLTKFNRIIPRYYSGTTLRNQKRLATAIKRARYMALLPYVLDVRFRSQAVAATPVIAPVSVALDESAVAV
jgi:small subunit ribosomal protein S18